MTADTQDWGVYQWDGVMHVAPVNEVHLHVANECRCGAWEKEEGVIVHLAFDGRQDFENGTRKPS